MMGGDERFYAWLDGELSGEEAAEVEARVAVDPELSRLAEEDRKLKQRLSAAFGLIADQPMPAFLGAIQEPEAQIVDLEVIRSRRASARPPLSTLLAMAASLAAGIVLGPAILRPEAGDGIVDAQQGHLFAQAALAKVLDGGLASTPGDDPVRIGVTYRDQRGSVCRSFSVDGADGLACRDGGRWRVEALLTSGNDGEGAYRMAAGTNPVIADLIASTINGQPFDAHAEKAASENGWR